MISKNLKNYSTKISVSKSINEIEKILAQHGARRVFKEYDGEGNVTALAFTIEIGHGMERKELAFKLPAEPEKVLEIFKKQLPPRYHNIEQAEKCAWRVLKDWIDTQTAMIHINQVKIEQVLLPFLFDMNTNKTLYDKFKERNFDMAIEDMSNGKQGN